jgi:hypothetical protein
MVYLRDRFVDDDETEMARDGERVRVPMLMSSGGSNSWASEHGLNVMRFLIRTRIQEGAEPVV